MECVSRMSSKVAQGWQRYENVSMAGTAVSSLSGLHVTFCTRTVLGFPIAACVSWTSCDFADI